MEYSAKMVQQCLSNLAVSAVVNAPVVSLTIMAPVAASTNQNTATFRHNIFSRQQSWQLWAVFAMPLALAGTLGQTHQNCWNKSLRAVEY
jgi:hypothetical protein